MINGRTVTCAYYYICIYIHVYVCSCIDLFDGDKITERNQCVFFLPESDIHF